jgi:hypothetical protein
MGSVRWALSWLVVFAVGLAPMLVYCVAGVIGRANPQHTSSPCGVARSPGPAEGMNRLMICGFRRGLAHPILTHPSPETSPTTGPARETLQFPQILFKPHLKNLRSDVLMTPGVTVPRTGSI